MVTMIVWCHKFPNGQQQQQRRPIIYLQNCQHHMAAKTYPYVGARGPTKGKFGQTMSPAVAAFVIKLIVPRHMFNVQHTTSLWLVEDEEGKLLQNMWRPRTTLAFLRRRYILRPLRNHLAILDLIHLTDANFRQAQHPGCLKARALLKS